MKGSWEVLLVVSVEGMLRDSGRAFLAVRYCEGLEDLL